MKITLDHLQVLQVAIQRSKQGMETLDEYINQHGLTAKRWRWDLLWRAKRLNFLPDHFIEDTIYSYCNDDHLDTALRHCTVTSK
jgi:hypothetical protein